MPIHLLIVGAGGFLGAIVRYLISGWCAKACGTRFPAGTLLVNVTGSFLLALIITLLVERLLAAPEWRLFWGIGFLGAYTTFSTFAWETDALVREGSFLLAAGNIMGNVVFALIAVKLGTMLARL